MKHEGRLAVFLAVLAIAVGAGQVRAQTVRYVDADSAAPAPGGTSWADAYPRLETALAVAAGGSQIWVAAGTYVPGSVKSSTFQLRNGVALYGGFAGTESAIAQRDLVAEPSVLSGEIGDTGDPSDNCDHVVTAESGATLDGFTIAFGYNTVNNGGGLYNIQKGMTVRNCTFTRNYAIGTGAAAGNTGGGGAIYFDANSASGLFTIDRCRFVENATDGSGGGVQIRGAGGNCRIDNSLFVNNARGGGRWGADIANERGSLASVAHVVNCTFYSPLWESVGSGTAGGGGQVGSLKLVNCLLYKDGIGTNWIGRVMNGADITVHNCLLDGYWNIGTSVGTITPIGTQLTFTDPKFANLPSTNLHLLAGSPCLDAGTSSTEPSITMPTSDLEGATRPLDGGYDIGAYEGGVIGQLPSGLFLHVR